MGIRKRLSVPTLIFLSAELILYYLILTAGGNTLVYSSFGAIVLCFVHVLLHFKTCNRFMLGGLACTVLADFCLVICSPIQQLWGMVFFLIAQSLYAAKLHLNAKTHTLLYIRLGLTLLALVVTALVLRDKTDPLALVSMCYYANLIMNIVVAFCQHRCCKLLPLAFVLFLLCDTVIGLQVACGGYLPIGESSLLHRIVFMNFNLSWFFYLPSQVLLSICAKAK